MNVDDNTLYITKRVDASERSHTNGQTDYENSNFKTALWLTKNKRMLIKFYPKYSNDINTYQAFIKVLDSALCGYTCSENVLTLSSVIKRISDGSINDESVRQKFWGEA